MSVKTQNSATAGLPLISVHNISKKYCRNLRASMWYGVRDIAGELFASLRKTESAVLRPDEFWALQDVSFELKRGESIAVIGANGAGKSTLLKLLYGLIRPDAGSITIRGNLGAMIELGAGLDPVLSGRENIYVRAALLGLRKERINPLVNLIIDFAGLHDFIDTPVQFYSSGMTARLAYAVAAYLKADVLLVDEVIAVGDLDFQRKCINHMLEYVASGNSLVLVSHQAHHIQSVCGRGILLESGRLTFSGTAIETLGRYLEQQNRKSELAAKSEGAALPGGEQTVVIEHVSIEPLRGEAIRARESVRLTVSYRALKTIDSAFWGFSVWTNDNAVCITGNFDEKATKLNRGAGELSCVIPKLPLTGGTYLLKTLIVETHSLQMLALSGWKTASTQFVVQSDAGLFNNSQLELNQLVTFDIEWR